MRRQLSGRGTLYLIGAVALLATVAAVALPVLLLRANAAASPTSLTAPSSQPAASQSGTSTPLQEQTATTTTGTQPSNTPSASPRATPRPSSTSGNTSSPSGTTPNGCATTSAELSGEQHLLSLLNSHRAAAGVPSLQLDTTLSNEARAHSCDMYQHRTLSHTGSDGSTPFQRITAAGVAYRAAGENIGDAFGYTVTAGLNADDSDMMAEPLTKGDHHWNIVNAAYTRVGLGVIYQGSTLYFTEDFVG